MKIEKVKLFAPLEQNRPIAVVNKQSSGILNWNDIKYPQFYGIYKSLLANFWTPLTF